MKARIADELTRTGLNSQIGKAIVTSIDYYKRQSFRFNQSRAATTLVSGQEYYGLPSDFIEMDTAVIVDGNWKNKLEERTHYWIDDNLSSTTYRSQPYVLAVQADQFRVYPSPDKDTYEVILTYTRSLGTPVADGDTSAWFTDGEEMIRLRSKIDVLTNIIRGPEAFQEAQLLRQREEEVLRGLRIAYKRSISSGRIVAAG
jgi:hypothetical protein